MLLKFINEKILKRKQKRKLSGGLGRNLTLGLAGIMLMSTLTGCNGDEAKTTDLEESTPVIEQSENTSEEKTPEDKIQELMERIEQLENNQNSDSDIDKEKQTTLFAQYEQGLTIIQEDLAAMDLIQDEKITPEEAKSLYTVKNIEFFMDNLKSQNILGLMYEDGLNISEVFKEAESAIKKIELHNSRQKTINNIYDLARLSIENEEDAISLRALSQTIYNVNSSDVDVATNAVNTVNGYHQYSSDVRVEYQTRDSNNNLVDHSLDKSALSMGGTFVANAYTYASIERNKDAYGQHADSITSYVDGATLDLDPTEKIILMVEDYCVRNNIILYNYQIGK